LEPLEDRSICAKEVFDSFADWKVWVDRFEEAYRDIPRCILADGMEALVFFAGKIRELLKERPECLPVVDACYAETVRIFDNIYVMFGGNKPMKPKPEPERRAPDPVWLKEHDEFIRRLPPAAGDLLGLSEKRRRVLWDWLKANDRIWSLLGPGGEIPDRSRVVRFLRECDVEFYTAFPVMSKMWFLWAQSVRAALKNLPKGLDAKRVDIVDFIVQSLRKSMRNKPKCLGVLEHCHTRFVPNIRQ
jgi:hypothetical protein